MYKIRIGCTDKDELSFDGKKIKPKNSKKIIDIFQPSTIPYIDTVCLLKKNNQDGFTTKTLELTCSKNITELEFIVCILRMKTVGFFSKHGTIQFVDTTTNYNVDGSTIDNIKFNYKFDTITPVKKKKRSHKKNKSSYSQLTFYKR